MTTIQILKQTPDQLIIRQPPESIQLVAILVLLLALALALVMFLHPAFRGTKRLYALIPFGMGGLILVVNLFSIGTSVTLDFSRANNLVQATRYFFGASRSRQKFPISRVNYAVVQVSNSSRGGGGTRLVLVLKDDREVIPFNFAFTDVKGVSEARDAINQFLGVHVEN